MKPSNGNPTEAFQGETISRVSRNGKNAKKDWIKWENDQYWGLKMKIQV